MIKKIFIVFTLLLISLGLSACGTSVDRDDLFDYTSMEVDKINFDDYSNFSNEELQSLLIKENTLVVGTSPDFAPSSFLDPHLSGISRVQGSESAIAFYISQALGLELEFEEVAFDGLTTALSNNTIDVIFSGLTYTAARAENYDFTNTYYKSAAGNQVLIVLKSNVDKYSSVDDINLSSISIGAQNGSLQQHLVETQLENTNYEPFDTIANGTTRLIAGEYDLMACTRTNAQLIMEQNSNIEIIDFFAFDTEDYGTMGLLKQGNELVDYLNLVINDFDQSLYGEWVTLFTEYASAITIESSNSFLGRLWNIITTYGLLFLEGTGITLSLSLLTVLFGTLLGVAVLAMKKNKLTPLKAISTVYVEVVRGVPLLLQLWVIYLIAPSAWPKYLTVVVALIINSGAYVSEIIRAGIDAIDKGQYEAARSLGLSKIQAMKKIILPQAIKKISPALGNEFVMLIKETSLASVFYIGDLMTIKNTITSLTYLSLEPYIVIAVIYFALTFSVTKLIKFAESKMEA